MGFTSPPTPTKGRGVVNTACARACSLSKQSGERKARNKSAQGNALGIVRNQHSPRMGKRIIIPLTPFATLQWWAVILLPPSGAYPSSILSPRALPGADISMPLRGVVSLTFRRICYPPEQKGSHVSGARHPPSLGEGRGGLLHHLLGRGAVRLSHKPHKSYKPHWPLLSSKPLPPPRH